MANELQFYGLIAQTGLTVVARVYTDAGAQVGGDVACPEVGSSAIYIGDMPAAVSGTYAVRFVSDGEVVGAGVIEWDGTQEVTGNDIIAETQQSEADVIAALPSVAGLATSAEIAALNDLSTADIAAELATYDAPTKAELDAAEANIIASASGGDATAASQTTIINAIAALNDLSSADVTAALSSSEPLDANVVQVTGVTVTGTGTKEDPWGP
ncbi:MAG: hypothetical protein AAFR21_11585 [Pseudomonadota bacterium]